MLSDRVAPTVFAQALLAERVVQFVARQRHVDFYRHATNANVLSAVRVFDSIADAQKDIISVRAMLNAYHAGGWTQWKVSGSLEKHAFSVWTGSRSRISCAAES